MKTLILILFPLGFVRCFAPVADNPLNIINIRYNENLKTGEEAEEASKVSFYNDGFRNVFTDRSSGGGQFWILQDTGTKSRYRIRNKVTGEYLVASQDMKDPSRRRVYTWTGNTPVAHALIEQEWDLIEEEDGFVIKNVKFGEYLYAAADEFAFDENNRSVFTWKNHDDLGREGYWKFE
jgi:hypothetical protein